MTKQAYKNHRRYVPGFHFLTASLCIIAFIAAMINLIHNWQEPHLHLSAAIIWIITIILCLFFWFIRSFSLGAQNRAIRAEERLRHYLLTGKPMDTRLRLGQIIALRFASDEEFPELTQKAVEENLRADDIKKAIRNWKADHHRV
jgi:hypothetical protein